MIDAKDKSAGMLRVVVKVRPEQYDELFRYVREIGLTMSAFMRESAVKAMMEAARPRPPGEEPHPRAAALPDQAVQRTRQGQHDA
jgi:hypothetical protein